MSTAAVEAAAFMAVVATGLCTASLPGDDAHMPAYMFKDARGCERVTGISFIGLRCHEVCHCLALKHMADLGTLQLLRKFAKYAGAFT